MAINKLLSRTRPASVARLAHRAALSACLAAMLMLVDGCGGGSSSAQTETPTLSSITVTPANPSIAAGTTKQFTATGSFSDGSQQDLTTSVSWTSSAPAVATINSSGLASGVSVGQATIAATSATVKGSTGLSVTAAALESIAVTPSTVSVLVGTTQQFTATGKYTDNSTQDISSSVSWSSSAPDVATVSSSGLATILASGKTSINASMDSVSAPAVSLTAEPPGTLGSALATSIACPSSTISGTCYQVAISCPSIIDFNGYVKVTHPTGTPLGTVAFSTGGNGTTLYETFQYGTTTLNDVLQGGYTVAQISWAGPFNPNQPKGWQTGPGGIRAVSCRYATIAQWIYTNIHLANKSAPFCATGNSGGAEVIGLALAHYGLGSIFAMVEPTSGPPFARQDWACDCLQPSTSNPCGIQQGYCVGLEDAQNFVDPAYTSPVSCSYEVQNLVTTYDPIFLNDSVLSPDAVLNYPNTFVNFLYGTLDTSTAPNQGHLWEEAITSSKAESCVAMAPHNMPDSLEGAQQIASDLLQYCKLPAGP
jgi:hypothetical protein